MRITLLVLPLAIVLMSGGTVRAETPIPRMKEQTLSILLGIKVRQRSKPVIYTGSGFVIGDGRHIVTNNHVCCGNAPKGMTETGRALFVRISRDDDGLIPDLPPRTSPPSKLDSEPFEVHSKG